MSAKTIQPGSPIRADHRMIRYLLDTMKNPVEHRPEEYAEVLKVFSKMGGSWERVFKGSVRDVVLLKKILKVAIKKGILSKPSKWG